MKRLILLAATIFLLIPKSKAGEKYGFGISFAPSLAFVSFKGDELAVQINESIFRDYAQSVLWNGTFLLERKYNRLLKARKDLLMHFDWANYRGEQLDKTE